MTFTLEEILKEFVDAEGAFRAMPLSAFDAFARLGLKGQDGFRITGRTEVEKEVCRAEYRKKHMLQRLCLACPKPAEMDRRKCSYHLAKDVERARRYQDQDREAWLEKRRIRRVAKRLSVEKASS